MVPLGQLIQVQNGFAFKSNDLGEIGMPVIKIKNIQPPNISLDDADRFPHKVEGKLSQFLVKKKDILISMTGSHVSQIASAVGKVGRYGFNTPALLNQRVGKLYSKDIEVLDNDYLYYFIARPEIQFELASNAGGSANQANISPQDIKDLEIDLPEIEEQRQIASILSVLDDKIELNRQMNQTLEQMAQTLFRQYFVEPLTLANHSESALRPSEHEKQPLGSLAAEEAFTPEIREEIGITLQEAINLPSGWKEGKIGDVCVVNSNTLSKKDSIAWLDYVEISAVGKGSINSIAHYKRGEEPSRARRKLKHGDTVLSTVRPDRGAYFLAVNPYQNLIASTGFAVFSPTTVPYTFLYLLLTQEESLNYYGFVANGAAYPAINPETILVMELTIPPKELLEKFHSLVEPMLLKYNSNNLENQSLTQTRDTLLPKLMSGEINVLQAAKTGAYEPEQVLS